MSSGSKRQGPGDQCAPSRFGLTQAHPIHPAWKRLTLKADPWPSLLTPSCSAGDGERTCSREALDGDADGTQGQISLVLRNVAPLSFPSLSVDGVGVQYGAHWFLMARRRDEPAAPHNNPDSSPRFPPQRPYCCLTLVCSSSLFHLTSLLASRESQVCLECSAQQEESHRLERLESKTQSQLRSPAAPRTQEEPGKLSWSCLRLRTESAQMSVNPAGT